MTNNKPLELGPEGEFEKKRLSRLVKIQRSDKAFFLLASHSYIESWLRQALHMWEDSYCFRDLIFKFKIELIENSKSFPSTLNVLQSLAAKEKTATVIKQNFSDITPEEASAAAYRLLQFCHLADIDNNEELEQIGSVLKSWTDRSLIPEDEITKLHQKLAVSQQRNKELLNEIEKLREYKSRIAELETEIRTIKRQNFGGQAQDLVNRMAEIEKNKKADEKIIETLKPADDYVINLERLTSYTRTRFDFERDITRLTDEQQEVLDCINLKNDFLVKGGAGTGKTLVLIKSLEKALQISNNELGFSDSPLKMSMLTYNRTLAKYDRYLAELLKQEEDSAKIETIDKFLYDRLRKINPDYKIIFDDDFFINLVKEHVILNNETAFRYLKEIDGLIYASDLSEDEYLKTTGVFNKKERKKIWETSVILAEKMKSISTYTKNFSRRIILDHLEKKPEDEEIHDTDFTFIDEVQDLTAADIKTVKACTRRAIIMAGDSDQAIYQNGFSFARSGIDIRGTTKILRTNFRNSIEIQKTASAYTGKPFEHRAFRTGPPPEMYLADNIQEINDLIVKRVSLFLNELCYDPENVCILVPSSRDIELLQDSLQKAGYESHDLRADGFSFKSRGVIRISTMHSSKGLDFPVVLLSLHTVPQVAGKTEEEKDLMRENLIYVSMTRAMDQLNIFCLKDEKNTEIKKLISVFKKTK